jgi:putative hydrolase of HD superfamily
MKAKDYLDILVTFGGLKDTTRHSYTKKQRQESVAEHSWRLAVMAYLMQDEFASLGVDINKVITMCLLHDLGEVITGDIPAFQKTQKDREVEEMELQKLLNSLPAKVRDRLKPLFAEMEEQKTIDARIYKALDKAEGLLQHTEGGTHFWTPDEFTKNFTYMDNYTHTPFLGEMRDDLVVRLRKLVDGERARKT